MVDAIVIRPSYPDDGAALARLAGRDTATVPPEPLLVAERGGELRAALSLRDRSHVADPFSATQDLVALLRHRADSVEGRPPAGRRASLARVAASWRLFPRASA